MATLMPEGKQQFFSNTGTPLVGGLLYTYAAGTTTPLPTYTTAAGNIANTNPIVLDSRGECVVFWSGSYKVTLTDSLGNLIYTVDNITSTDSLITAALAGFSASTFAPLLQNQTYTAFTTGGIAPNFTLTTTPVITAYATNQRFNVTFNVAGTTGSNTLNIDGIGVKNLKQYNSFGVKQPAFITAGMISDVEYDGTDFVVLNSLPVNVQVPDRQTVLCGAVDANGKATILSIGTGLAVGLLATTVPVDVAFAGGFGSQGTLDYVQQFTADSASAWSSLTPSSTLYLYMDRNISTGAIIFGFSTLVPNYGYAITKSIVSGQHTYVINEGLMYVGNGSTNSVVQRVFIGECVTGASTVTSVTSYAFRRQARMPPTAFAYTTALVYAHNLGINMELIDFKLKGVTLVLTDGWPAGTYLELLVNRSDAVAAFPLAPVTRNSVQALNAYGYTIVTSTGSVDGIIVAANYNLIITAKANEKW